MLIRFECVLFDCRHKQPLGDIEQYVERISVPEDKYILYMELRSYWKAMEVAAKLKDPYKLQDVSIAHANSVCYFIGKY